MRLFPDFIDNHFQLKRMEEEDMCTVLVGAVDNHVCRKVMHKYFKEANTLYYFDAANEYSAGEVVVGAKICGNEIYPDRVHYFRKYWKTMLCPKVRRAAKQLIFQHPSIFLQILLQLIFC